MIRLCCHLAAAAMSYAILICYMPAIRYAADDAAMSAAQRAMSARWRCRFRHDAAILAADIAPCHADADTLLIFSRMATPPLLLYARYARYAISFRCFHYADMPCFFLSSDDAVALRRYITCVIICAERRFRYFCTPPCTIIAAITHFDAARL